MMPTLRAGDGTMGGKHSKLHGSVGPPSPNPVTSGTLGLAWRRWGPTAPAGVNDCGRTDSRTLHALRWRGSQGPGSAGPRENSVYIPASHLPLPNSTASAGKGQPGLTRNAVLWLAVCRWAPTKQMGLWRWKTEQPIHLAKAQIRPVFPIFYQKR